MNRIELSRIFLRREGGGKEIGLFSSMKGYKFTLNPWSLVETIFVYPFPPECSPSHPIRPWSLFRTTIPWANPPCDPKEMKIKPSQPSHLNPHRSHRERAGLAFSASLSLIDREPGRFIGYWRQEARQNGFSFPIKQAIDSFPRFLPHLCE